MRSGRARALLRRLRCNLCNWRLRATQLGALLALLLVSPAATAQQGQPGLGELGWLSLYRSPRDQLAEERRLLAALAALKPQRRGIVDAYVLSVALDSDPVFGREAREAGRVLARRYDAGGGRSLVLAGGEGAEPGLPGTPGALQLALARVAELIDPQEDALVLYLTSHGAPQWGLAYRDPARGAGAVPPFRLRAMLDEAGAPNRLVIVSACFSGVFVPALAAPASVVVTAAAADRPSFGCDAGNDWTFFGDALINRALRKPQPLSAAFAEARDTVGGWERARGLHSSEPQMGVGPAVAAWLAPLERRMPKDAGAPVGRSPAGMP